MLSIDWRRGLLGLWGANLSVAPVVLRSGEAAGLEVLLGTAEDSSEPTLPKGFLLPGETPEAGVRRVLESDTSWAPEGPGEVIAEGYRYDPRQTDHAWVETRGTLIVVEGDDVPDLFEAGGEFEDAGWWPLDASTANRLPSGQAGILRDAVTRLRDSGRMDSDEAALFLDKTG